MKLGAVRFVNGLWCRWALTPNQWPFTGSFPAWEAIKVERR